MSLKEFSRFRLTENAVLLMRTRDIYQMYLALAYVVGVMAALVWLSRRTLMESGQFVAHIYKWAFLNDRISRVEVYKAELEE